MGVIAAAKGIPKGCQGLFTHVSLGYPLSVFNKNSTLKRTSWTASMVPSPLERWGLHVWGATFLRG